MSQTESILAVLKKQKKPYKWVIQEFSKVKELKGLDLDLELLTTLGLNLVLDKNNDLSLKTRQTKIKDEIFCIVDIESTGGIKSGKILEIGAVKISNSKEIARFERLVNVDFIPENITNLTGINLEMTKKACSIKKVMYDFKNFLQDSIFIAHNVKFDYEFISKTMHECGFGILLNQKFCSIELAQCCIESTSYKLSILKEMLNIENTHHRALDDALAAAEIVKYCLGKIPHHIQTTEELIHFTKTARLKVK